MMSQHHEKTQKTSVLTYEGICITKADLDCLTAREYINDNIINFWLKYMFQTLLTGDQQNKVLICDTHFMTALEKMNTDCAYRWLRKMHLFKKEFIIIPVLEEDHWFLMTLEYPKNAYNHDAPNFRTRVRFWDSMGIDYLSSKKNKLCKVLFKFVRCAYLYEKSESMNEIHNIGVHHEDVDQQQNTYDCGLHLLVNAEKFILLAFDIGDMEADDELVILLNRKRKKRSTIRALIHRLADGQTLAEAQDDFHDDVEFVSPVT